MIVSCFDPKNHIVLVESFKDNERTLVDNEQIIKDNECPALNNEMPKEDSELIPKVGMKFNNEKEVFEFYKRYAYHVGFLVKKSLKKGDDGVVRYVGYACNREGKRNIKPNTSLNSQPTIQLGCKDRMTALYRSPFQIYNDAKHKLVSLTGILKILTNRSEGSSLKAN